MHLKTANDYFLYLQHHLKIAWTKTHCFLHIMPQPPLHLVLPSQINLPVPITTRRGIRHHPIQLLAEHRNSKISLSRWRFLHQLHYITKLHIFTKVHYAIVLDNSQRNKTLIFFLVMDGSSKLEKTILSDKGRF